VLTANKYCTYIAKTYSHAYRLCDVTMGRKYTNRDLEKEEIELRRRGERTFQPQVNAWFYKLAESFIKRGLLFGHSEACFAIVSI